jgi:uncharacterized membrane-anchored protein
MIRMRLTLRRSRVGIPGTIAGIVRMDRRTNRLAARVRPGEIALIDHLDLDRVTAESLVSARVAAVLNARASISGRYPNLGPELLIQAGIPLLDNLGDGIFSHVRDGDLVSVTGHTVRSGPVVVAEGVRQDADSVAAAMGDAREGLSVQLEAFAANTAVYLRQERGLLLDGLGLPKLKTRIAGRPCVVVVRGYAYREELAKLAPYLAEVKAVLIGVDGGADALLEAGHQPDLIVGDLDAVSDGVLRGGAELVLRANPDGRSPALARVAQLNLPTTIVPAVATGADLALLLADAGGAAIIVTVGSPATLSEFLDRGRTGAASTFLTRLKVGGTVVSATVMSQLYRPRAGRSALVAVAVSALVTMVAAAAAVTVGHGFMDVLADRWNLALTALQGLFG